MLLPYKLRRKFADDEGLSINLEEDNMVDNNLKEGWMWFQDNPKKDVVYGT